MQEHVICVDILTMETFITNVTPIAWFLETNQGWRETVTKAFSENTLQNYIRLVCQFT